MNSEEKNGLASNTEERQKIPIQSAGAPEKQSKRNKIIKALLDILGHLGLVLGYSCFVGFLISHFFDVEFFYAFVVVGMALVLFPYEFFWDVSPEKNKEKRGKQ